MYYLLAMEMRMVLDRNHICNLEEEIVMFGLGYNGFLRGGFRACCRPLICCPRPVVPIAVGIGRGAGVGIIAIAILILLALAVIF